MKQPLPPVWVDRFLRWYCDPDLLEEIQGDLHELYYERLHQMGKTRAGLYYAWDVFRFCRTSNIKATGPESNWSVFWNVGMKLAFRNVWHNPLLFFVKLGSLAVCLSFALVLLAFVLNETRYDRQIPGYENMYRVGCRALIAGKTATYAVSPLPLGDALAHEVKDVESYTRFISMYLPTFSVNGERFEGITTYLADSSFLNFFDVHLIDGSRQALYGPNRVVLTESTAIRLLGRVNVVGETVRIWNSDLEVSGVIRDLPLNTHLTYQALVSWPTFHQNDAWDNLNAYTYIKLRPQTSEFDATRDIDETIDDYLTLISDELQVSVDPVLQRVDRIHQSAPMNEDFASRRNPGYIFMAASVIVIFLFSGILNYLNLALAELTTQVKRIAILRTFGGTSVNQRHVPIADSLLTLVIAIPLVALIVLLAVRWSSIVPPIDESIWSTAEYWMATIGLLAAVVALSALNGWMVSRVSLVATSWRLGKRAFGLGIRRVLAATQLSLSIIMIAMMVIVLDQFEFIERQDKGFDERDVVVLRKPGQPNETAALVNSLRGLAGVKSVAACSFYPGGDIETKDLFEVETSDGRKNVLLNFFFFTHEYPTLMNLKLESGRWFDQDRPSDRTAYIVNETAGRQFGWKNPIGKQISGYGIDGEVIGVVKDFHFESFHTPVEPVIMFLQDPNQGAHFLYIKTDPFLSHEMLPDIERIYRDHVTSSIFDFGFLEARYRALYSNDYQVKAIFFWGLVITVLVSGFGVFSISALMLSLRTREMGIRRVVGAGMGELFVLHLKPFAVFFLLALILGLPLSYYLSWEWLDNFAYHIDWTLLDWIMPAVYATLIILIASGYHAWRNAHVNAVDVIKSE